MKLPLDSSQGHMCLYEITYTHTLQLMKLYTHEKYEEIKYFKMLSEKDM